MKFINRKFELERLDRLASSKEGGVAVIWGRRRVGKTRLLLEWVNKHKGIYFTADESSSAVQRKYFALALEQALPSFSNVDYPDWNSLLMRLASDAQHFKWKGPIIIDELPYLISSSPEFPSILQKFIDREAKQANLVIALCGSSQRMMQGAVLESSAPLYGRAKELIKLGPISAGYIGEALELKEPKEMIESYAIWGGIPRYWELVKGNDGSLLENIDRLVLDPMGPLNDEPYRLLIEEMPPAISLRPILDAIGLGAHRLSEIATRLGTPPTSLVRPIQRLRDLDLIEREAPHGIPEHNSKRVLYKIKDPFVRFWFEVVAPKRSFFAQASSINPRNLVKEELAPLFALTWEELCRLALPSIAHQWNDQIYGQANRYWHGQGPEWDILTESANGKSLLIGEAKWTTKTPNASWVYKTIDEIKSKGVPPIPRNPTTVLSYILFIPEKPKQLTLPPNTKVIDAEEVLHALRST